MRQLVRTWPALSALGAGLVHLAVAASSPMWMTAVLLVMGVSELGWAVTSLTCGDAVAPRLFLAVTLAPTLAAGIWMGISMGAMHGGMHSGVAMSADGWVPALGAAAALDLVAAFACASAMRRLGSASPTSTVETAADENSDGRAGSSRIDAGRFAPTAAPTGSGALRAVAGILVGAALVAAVAVPALGSTDAGHQATTHMQM